MQRRRTYLEIETGRNRGYGFIVLLTFLLCAGATAALNYVADPYDIYHTPRVPSLNANKPGQHGQDRMVKAEAVRQQHPDVLLLGTSRTQFGIDPNNRDLKRFGQRPYNAGLLGSGPYLALRYLQHAEANSHVRLVIMGLDPMMFAAGTDEAGQGFSEDRLDVDSAGTPGLLPAWAHDVPTTLLSTDAVEMSLRTLLRQKSIVTDLLDNGLRNPQVLQAHSDANHGTRGNFEATERDYLDMFRDYWVYDESGHSRKLDALAELLDFAHAHGTAVRLYISPSHARMNTVIRVARKQEEVEAWKRAVVMLVDEDARRHPQSSPVPLMDFSDANPYTTERLPTAQAPHGAMRWYWETSHFKTSLGDMVLKRVLTGQGPKNFGHVLTRDNVERQLNASRQRQRHYEANHPDEIQEIELMGESLARGCVANKDCG